jgi:hypothetical protein
MFSPISTAIIVLMSSYLAAFFYFSRWILVWRQCKF